MVEIVYLDERGAGHVHYPRSEAEAEACMKRLAKRRIEAEMRWQGQRIGAVQVNPASDEPGQAAYTWWFDPEPFE